jgi:hypothetical protein
MRTLLAALVAVLVVGCATKRGNPGDFGDSGLPADACVGLQCRVADCAKINMPPTSISGTVYAPNGTLALFGVTVYVPNIDPPKFVDGVKCDRCDTTIPGEPIAHVISDEAGHFKLDNIPSGTDVPLIITVGKWRRRVLIPVVNQCADNPLPANLTSLPKNRLEGELPKIAVSTGTCDALECLIRKIGVSDNEFTASSDTGRIHLYSGNGANTMANNTPLMPSTSLWGDIEQMKKYDMVLFSCECSQNANTKPQSAMNALKGYADLGGRVFLSHYHNVWIAGETGVPTHAPAVWPGIATCTTDGYATGNDIIDTVNNPKGTSFANWMMNVGATTMLGSIVIQDSRQTCNAIDKTKAERWVYFPSGGIEFPQNFQFTTPNEADKDHRCGKVVMSDMHVASGSTSSPGTGFPGGCSVAPMTPQEKALAFMFFDIASCVGVIF